MKDEDRPEPYEVMNEGDATQFVDRLTKAVSLVMLVLIGVLLYTLDARAGENWCSQWAEGYAAGFCFHTRQCYIAPKVCPAPEGGEIDGYMRGLRDGLQDRRARI